MAMFKGFSAADTENASPENEDEYFACGLTALQGNVAEEAYLCFSRLKNSAAAQFNLALCYCSASLFDKALTALESAERLIVSKAVPTPQGAAIPAPIALQSTRGNGYRSPMALQTANLFPKQALLRIFRLRADIYATLGYTDKLLQLLPALNGNQYENIEKIKASLGLQDGRNNEY